MLTRDRDLVQPSQFVKLRPNHLMDMHEESKLDSWIFNITNPPHLIALLPAYCAIPPSQLAGGERKLNEWVGQVMQWKCNGRLTSVACYNTHHIDPFTPCIQDIHAALVEDYAWSKGWCEASHSAAAIPTLTVEIPSVGPSLWNTELPLYTMKKKKQSKVVTSDEIKLAFFMTVYKEPELVLRILNRLYSPRHLYIVHVDASFPYVLTELRSSVAQIGTNIHVVSVLHVVYMASSASRLIAQAMMFFLKLRQSGVYFWHYFVACTGSDYPLLPLTKIEQILAARVPHMPSVMNWSPITWKHAYTQAKQSAESSFVRDTINLLERRGSNSPAARRATEQFGVPLTCEGQKSYVRLNARIQAPVPGKEGRLGEDSQVSL